MYVRPWIAAFGFVLTACVLLAAGRAFAYGADPSSVRLIDQQGEAFTLASLRGHPTIVTFVATRCRDACPISNAVFSALATRFERERIAATLVTFTLDPQYDTPFVMSRTAEQFGARAPRWRFAAGKPEEMRTLMAFFGVQAQAADNDDLHSNGIYILDAQGRLLRSTLLSTNAVEEIDRYLQARR
jgi:protein SCO1/2